MHSSTYSPIRLAISLQIRHERRIEHLLRHRLPGSFIGHVPELLMLFMQQHDRTAGLHMERRRAVEKGMLYQLDDAPVWYRGFFLQIKRRAADNGGFEERDLGG